MSVDLSPEKLNKDALEKSRTEFLKDYAAICEKHGLEIAFQPVLRPLPKKE